MKGNPKQDDPLIQNLHDAGCSQQIIEQFMQSRKEGNIFCQMHILVKQRNLLLEDLHKDQNKLDCLDYLLFQLKKGCWNSPAAFLSIPSPIKDTQTSKETT
ncbi:hypothetical protein [Bilophila wadsworthia]|nr:hypothetical protein [Bilophila wadsworthia]